ncbi:MAG: CoA transferase [Chloroflexi bacterium]|nr:CoA transferase [Chloroflexota bacterium]
MPGALDGIRVIDFGQYVAGPLTAVMLADEGADVIHIDPPGGPLWKDPADAFFNRGKRRISIDLKDPAGLALGQRLIASGDVVVENFRPGVMDRLGVGARQMTEEHPWLVYTSLPGFAANDPRARVAAWEGVIKAATEDCRVRVGEEPEGWDRSRPTYSALPIASNFAAFLAAAATVNALTARHRTGKGQRVEVPLFNAMFEAIGAAGAYVTARGLPPQRPLAGNGSGTYRCQDGRYVQLNPIGSSTRFLGWLLQEAGVAHWAAEGFLDGARLRAEPELSQRLVKKLTELFLTRPAAEWEQLAHKARAPLSFIRTTAEWIGNDHARASNAVVQVNDPELGPTWMAGLPVHTTGTPVVPSEPRHLPDADRAAILAELDSLPPRQPLPAREPALQRPLDGMKVVDLTQILAGPTAGRMLGEYGAEVVKINYPKRNVGAHGFVNRGKRTVLLNVEAPQGQSVFWKLVEQADVVTQNFPQGTAERYGIGYEQVKAHKPDIVYVSVSCYGHQGPWGPQRGYETQGQAVSGIMERAGGDHRPEVLGPYNLLDYGTGCMASFAAALGIYHRVSTGHGQHVQASLAQTGTYQQTAYLLDYAGKSWDEPRGPEALGLGPLQRFYQAQDGWFFFGARPHDLPALERIHQLAGIAGLQGVALERALEAAFATGCVADWVERLRAGGAGAHEIVPLADLMVDPFVRDLGLSVRQVSEEVGEVTMPGLAVSLSGTPPALGAAVRQPGADAPLVLAQVGLGAQIEQLEREWVLQATALPAGWGGGG